MIRYDGVEEYHESKKAGMIPNRISEILPPGIETLTIRKINTLDYTTVDYTQQEEISLRDCSARTWLSALAVDIPSYFPELRNVNLSLWNEEDLASVDDMKWLFRSEAGVNIEID